MIRLIDQGVLLSSQGEFVKTFSAGEREEGQKMTIAYNILKNHNQSADMENLRLTFDSLVSPDNNYVSILQTARAAGLEYFPVPYVLSNCHHTLCAAGGTVNEDDHVFGLGNAVKYGGIFVPPYISVLHQYMRECMAGGGKMILGSDSHTRYGALGTMGIGEGGGEVVKQLLAQTYDLKRPPVIAVRLVGKPSPGVGPMDVVLALAAKVFANGFVKNKILEFVGEGIKQLSVEYRIGIDVMTTECAALSSIWCTDEPVREYLKEHGREGDYRELQPTAGAFYDGAIEIDLAAAECMIALPFHPSHAVSIREFQENMAALLEQVETQGNRIKGAGKTPFSIMDHIRDDAFYVDQALVTGCSGGMFENISAMADILKGYSIPGNGLKLGINPASQPVMSELMRQGIAGELMDCGVTFRPAICGPCFGVTDVPANNQISIRHMTRNYPNRDGSKPGQGQMTASCLMDARSIAATVKNGGRLTAATEMKVEYTQREYHFNPNIYKSQIFDNFGQGIPDTKLVFGPNIADWPKFEPLTRHLLLKVSGVYEESVTTDELTPSGEASSFRSNPDKISEYTLINRDPDYIKRAKAVRQLERDRQSGCLENQEMADILKLLCEREECTVADITIGSVICGHQIGDGSSREQAASCQKVLGGFSNIALEYATKRYRSNLLNWGILPIQIKEPVAWQNGEYIFIQDIAGILKSGQSAVELERIGSLSEKIGGDLGSLTDEEREILQAGSLIGYQYQLKHKNESAGMAIRLLV